MAPLEGGTRRRLGKRRLALLAVAALVVLGLVFGGVAYAIPGLFSSPAKSVHLPPTATPVLPATSATVTITPASKHLQNTFTLAAVTGAPDASQGQVAARQISVTTPAQSKTVNATGQGSTRGTSASGTLVICSPTATTIYAGSTYPNNSIAVGSPTRGWLIVISQTVSAPSNPNCSSNLFVYTTGHFAQTGAAGNSNFWYLANGFNSLSIASNSSLTGGTDPQAYTAVAQSDINNAVNSLSANPPDPQQALQSQVGQGEQFIGTPQCARNVSANHNAGDQASTVTVTVSFTCSGEVYNYDGALALATKLLSDQAAKDPGAGYALVGAIKTTLTNATLGDQGTVTLIVSADGLWAYQFTDADKQAIATALAGLTLQEATNLLLNRAGVVDTLITLTGGNAQILPKDPKQIKIVVQAVQGS